MNHISLYKSFLFIGFLLMQQCTLLGQNVSISPIAHAQRVYEQFAAGQGDSVYIGLSKEVQLQLTPDAFNGMYKQVEQQFGKLQSKGEWQVTQAQGHTFYFTDLKFAQGSLRFLLSFDADGCINTIRLMPVPQESVATSEATGYDKTKLSEREIIVTTDGFNLPGTLTMPVGKTNVPVVILVHGSGPNDRDETIGPNKPFRDIAWGLANAGIASIRYDKRTKVYGVKSVPTGRTMDYDVEAVDDAVSAVNKAKTLEGVAPDSIYVLGHSLGGTLAPRIAERAKGLKGIIILAGLARPLEDAVVQQTEYLSSLADSSALGKAQVAEIRQQAQNIKKLGTAAFDNKIPMLFNTPQSYWALANVYKPVAIASKLSLPILILQGERDYQVTMKDFGLWRAGLLKHKNVFFKSYPKLNHIMQEGVGKSTPAEYNKRSSVPVYLINDIASFIRNNRL